MEVDDSFGFNVSALWCSAVSASASMRNSDLFFRTRTLLLNDGRKGHVSSFLMSDVMLRVSEFCDLSVHWRLGDDPAVTTFNPR